MIGLGTVSLHSNRKISRIKLDQKTTHKVEFPIQCLQCGLLWNIVKISNEQCFFSSFNFTLDCAIYGQNLYVNVFDVWRGNENVKSLDGHNRSVVNTWFTLFLSFQVRIMNRFMITKSINRPFTRHLHHSTRERITETDTHQKRWFIY